MSSKSKVINPSFFFFLGTAVVEEETASDSAVEWRRVRLCERSSQLTLMPSMIRTDEPIRDGTKPEEYWVDNAAKMAPALAWNLMVLSFVVNNKNHY